MSPHSSDSFSRICRLAPVAHGISKVVDICNTDFLPTPNPLTMSRFFTQGDSSSESSSSDEEELYSDNEAEQKSEAEESEEEEASEEEESSSCDVRGKSGASKFLREAASSDESEDEDKTHVVKSAKDKRLEELEGVVKIIDNAVKINDWSTIATGVLFRLGVFWGILD